jgi:hypothetical protein
MISASAFHDRVAVPCRRLAGPQCSQSRGSGINLVPDRDHYLSLPEVDREVGASGRVCPRLARHTALFRPDVEEESIYFLTGYR